MKAYHATKTVFFDVDDTLVLWSLDKPEYEPHLKHITLLKKFHKRGHMIVVWSAGGSKWAERIVKELNLEEHVDLVLSKPDWYVDDLPASEFLPEAIRIYKN